MGGIIVDSLSLKQIRDFAKKIRIIFGIEDDVYVDIVRVYEYILQSIEVTFEIVDYASMGDKHGETLIGRNVIRIREDVYDRACKGYGRDRLTMAHELGHLLLHNMKNLSLARNANQKVAAYSDPEWQANAFAGELLAPHRFLKGKSVDEIANSYGISISAAQVQKNRRKG